MVHQANKRKELRTLDKEINDGLWPEWQYLRIAEDIPDNPRSLLGTYVQYRVAMHDGGATAGIGGEKQPCAGENSRLEATEDKGSGFGMDTSNIYSLCDDR